MRSATPRIPLPATRRWQEELAVAITSIEELARELGLSVADLRPGETARQRFALRIPRGFVRRMARGDPRDPLLLQVLPTASELINTSAFLADPLEELRQLRRPGLLQKYQGRTLLLVSGACAINCRYCFRREFPYAEAAAGAGDLQAALDDIRADSRISEVILSGGDPLTLGNARLDRLLTAIGQIGHVQRVRIHSRLPVVLPERVDSGLVETLARARQPVVMVLHANHPNEIDESLAGAMQRLQPVTAALLNQSVLLKSINDDASTLCALSERLFAIGVLPYYLHQLDPVRGAAHFRVGDRRARRIMAEVAARLPGYLVPRLVRERPGLPGKELLAPARHKRAQVT
jgi:EF-P beta-lysylation protein EpmB